MARARNLPVQPGRIVTSDGTVSVQITPEDMLWAARSVAGEILSPKSSAAGPTDEADVLWTLTQRFVRWLKLGKDLSFIASTRGFSQPINPIWASLEASGCQRHPELCTKAHLKRRQEITTATWEDLAARDAARGTRVVETTRLWAEGRLRNTVPRSTNFAIPTVSASHIEGMPGAEVVVKRGGHWYISDPPATRWPDGFVMVESPDRRFVSGEDTKPKTEVFQAFWDALTVRSFWGRG